MQLLKKLFLTSIVISSVSFTEAQSSISPKIGITFSKANVEKSNYGTYKPGVGLLLGFTKEMPFSKRVDFRTGLEYEQRAYLYESGGIMPLGGGPYTMRSRYHNLLIPLNFRLHIGSKKIFFMSIGGYAGVTLFAKYKIDLSDGTSIKDEEELPQPFLVGGALGLGFRIPVTETKKIVMELRSLADLPIFVERMDFYSFNLTLGHEFGKTK